MDAPKNTFWKARYLAWDPAHPAEAIYLDALPNIVAAIPSEPVPLVQICQPCNAIRWPTTNDRGEDRGYIVSGAQSRAEVSAQYPDRLTGRDRLTDGIPFSMRCTSRPGGYVSEADRPGAPEEKTATDLREAVGFFTKPLFCTPFPPTETD